MTRLDWWTGIILIIVCALFGNAALSGVWMHSSREWWHYVLPFWLGGGVGFFAAALMAAAKQGDADAERRRRLIADAARCRNRELEALRRVPRPAREGGERN